MNYNYVFQQLANNIHASDPGWEPYRLDSLTFSEYGFDGTSHYTLVVKESVRGNRVLIGYPTIRRKIKLISISESYYQYLLSSLYNNPGNEGLLRGMIDPDPGVSESIKFFLTLTEGPAF